MKLMIASDLHGSAACTRRLMEAYTREQPDKLLLLGDILYHGPRNDLPEEYAPKLVIAMLNPLKEKILCVHGNCDAEVDQMVLDFPITAESLSLDLDGRTLVAVHGHHPVPALSAGDVLVSGHTHVPLCEQCEGVWYLNPGSVSIPKENSPHSYMVYEAGTFLWKTLNGEEYRRHTL
ncbi:MAG: phosphodiesterase [Clostridia bacterium]|nr:phosphodiesterase [Clostridia bacterium]